MSFRWRQLLKISLDHLNAANLDEARIRSAMNRAYYAAYGEARIFVSRHGHQWVGWGGYHQQVWNFLRQGSGVTAPWQQAAWKSIGDAGLRLRSQRVIADYYDSQPVSEDSAKEMVATGTLLIRKLDGFP